ncbi:Protein CBG06557 [Caenorhabditis briggsae]|uniref:Protein CBG06557 n=1 Tax=Caenorhabditis briggsae TaxID=6238 RepID=A8X2I7_CAEBR|nr:Protein CBG06557 [Caenorhabditis briggsae]CAP26847.1 Protein CBG06557 [Caenorhabditis briggsae]
MADAIDKAALKQFGEEFLASKAMAADDLENGVKEVLELIKSRNGELLLLDSDPNLLQTKEKLDALKAISGGDSEGSSTQADMTSILLLSNLTGIAGNKSGDYHGDVKRRRQDPLPSRQQWFRSEGVFRGQGNTRQNGGQEMAREAFAATNAKDMGTMPMIVNNEEIKRLEEEGVVVRVEEEPRCVSPLHVVEQGDIGVAKARWMMQVVGENQKTKNKSKLARKKKSPGEEKEIEFWRARGAELLRRNLLEVESMPDFFLYTDASARGIGGLLKNERQDILWKMTEIGDGNFEKQSSAWRELTAVEVASARISSNLKGRVQVLVDSQAAVSVLRRGSMKPELHSLAERVWHNLENVGESSFLWIPREKNVEADEASRNFDFDDWGIAERVFSHAQRMWGEIKVDWFADANNKKTELYFSRYPEFGTSGVNVFEHVERAERMGLPWLVPPPVLIPQLIKIMRRRRLRGVLVAPLWKSHISYQALVDYSGRFIREVKDYIIYEKNDCIFIPGEGSRHCEATNSKFYPKCMFNHTEINSKTVEFFPLCNFIYGIIVINENTDLSANQLKNVFKKMTSLAGGIRVENSNFEHLSFFSINKVLCVTYGIFILNNQNLTDVGFLTKVNLEGDDLGNECDFRVENNTKLNAESLCDQGKLATLMDMRFSGNLKDCESCQGDQISDLSISTFQNCTKILRGLQLDNFTNLEILSSLSKIEIIRGGINIQNSQIENLSFLENLDDLEINNFGENENLVINLEGNPNLKRLSIPNWREIINSNDGIKLVNIQYNHPDFCLTIEDITFFLENFVSFFDFNLEICQDSREQIEFSKICSFYSMENLPDACNIIKGNIVINSGDEKFMYKLKSILYLFGSLTIQNTTLESLEDINSLKYILHTDDSLPIFQIVGNKNLTNSDFVEMLNIVTTGNREAIFQDNHRDIFRWSNGCNLFFYFDKDTVIRRNRLKLDFIGGDCGERIQIVYRTSKSVKCLYWFVICILLIFI